MVGDTGPGDPNHIGEASAKVFDEFGYEFYNREKKKVNERWYGQGEESGTRFRYVLSIASSRPKYSVKTANEKINKKGKKLYDILKDYGYTTAKSLKK